MPNRILRDDILGSKAVNSLSDSGEIFYRRLMSVVDDYGRFEADHELIRARCFPRQLDRWPLSRVSDALSECGEARSSDGAPLLTLYCVPPSSVRYLQINKFGQRIRSDKKGVVTLSKYPAPSIGSEARRSAAESGEAPPYALAKSYAESYAETSAGTRPPVPIRAASPDYQPRIEAMYATYPKPGFKQEGTMRILDLLSNSVHPENVLNAFERTCAEWVAFWAANPLEYVPGFGKFFEEGYHLRKPKAREPTAFKSKQQQQADEWRSL